METGTVRWGVLSTANIGRKAVGPAIQASRNGTLHAVASRTIEGARAYAGELNVPVVFGSYPELIDATDIDALYIPLPNGLHREWTLLALAAGKHVLCEKPLALDAAEAREMAAAAADAGLLLMEAFMYRFHPRIEALMRHVRSGGLGSLRAIQSAFTFRLTRPDNIRLDPGLGGGALMDVGCYCVNVSRTLVGSEPVEVDARARWTSRGVDDELSGVLRFADGVEAQIQCALTQARRERVHVGGSDAWIDVPAAFLPGTGPVSWTEHGGFGGPRVVEFDGVDQYRRMVEHFADCVLTGALLRYPATEAAANMAVIDALYRSARDECVVPVTHG